MPKPKKLPVSIRAIMQRINRALPEHQQLKSAARSARWQAEVGLHYIVDGAAGHVVSRNVDLEQLARKLGCIKEWEEVANE
jgi:hypothetical protein